MLKTKVTGDLTLARQIQALGLPANKRATLHRKLGREVIKQSRARIREQKTLTGDKFKVRAGDKKGRMLKRIARGSNVKAYTGANKATVTWPNAMIGKVARAQQEGHSERYTAARMKRERGQPDYAAPASQDQAKALMKAGFKLKKGKYKSGKNKGQTKTRRVSQAWIKENMTVGQAGLILRLMRDKKAEQAWNVTNPARPFFGLNKQEIKQLGNELINNLLDGATGTR